MEIKNHSPEEVLTQILVNQELLLETAIRWVTPHCASRDNREWLNLNRKLIDEYHRTREITGQEFVGEFWKEERE